MVVQLKKVAATSSLTVGCGILLFLLARAHLRYNTTASAPLGWYWFTPLSPTTPLPRNTLVQVQLSAWARHELRQVAPWIDGTRPVLKTVQAGPGDTVCLEGDWVQVNGHLIATRSLYRHYPLTPLEGCTTLDEQSYFLLNPAPRSYDGRYMGPTARQQIQGILQALWTWEDAS